MVHDCHCVYLLGCQPQDGGFRCHQTRKMISWGFCPYCASAMRSWVKTCLWEVWDDQIAKEGKLESTLIGWGLENEHGCIVGLGQLSMPTLLLHKCLNLVTTIDVLFVYRHLSGYRYINFIYVRSFLLAVAQLGAPLSRFLERALYKFLEWMN